MPSACIVRASDHTSGSAADPSVPSRPHEGRAECLLAGQGWQGRNLLLRQAAVPLKDRRASLWAGSLSDSVECLGIFGVAGDRGFPNLVLCRKPLSGFLGIKMTPDF